MRRIVLVHGFTQTGASWAAIADALADDGFEVITVDAPGHGGSSAVRADLWGGAELLTDTGGPATYVGYSMGARLALHAALLRPNVVRRLVLLGATAGIEDAAERAQRRTDDERLASELERDGIGAFLDRWVANPLFSTLPESARGMADRASNTVKGLAGSLRLAGTGTQDPPLWARLHELGMPTLVMAGALDTKFAALARRLKDGIGQFATLHLIESAGHSAHLEQPAKFIEAVRHFAIGSPSA